MKIQRAELLKALNHIKPGLATTIKSMEYATFTGDTLLAYNDQIGVLYPFETDFEVAINYDDLYKVISKTKIDEIDLSMDGAELRITGKTTKAGFNSITTEEIDESIQALYAQIPNEENGLDWIELPTDFISGALLCISAAATDTTQGTLACLYVGGADLICSDNLRISHYIMNEDLGINFFIRAGVIRDLASFDFTHICISKSWVHFITEDGVIFSTRLIRGKDFDYYLTKFDGFKGTAVKLPEGLQPIVDAAAVMAEDDVIKDMWITLQEDEMTCATQNARGWIEKTIPLKFKRKTPIEFQVSATFLQQILNLPYKMTVGKDKSLFESGSFRHLLLHRVKQKAVE